MTPRELFSSDEIIAALERGGFYAPRKPKGSHQTFHRLRADGRGHDVATVIVGRKEVPRGTLEGILRQANVTWDEFLEWAKVKRRGSGDSSR